jgi:hypothetical protein
METNMKRMLFRRPEEMSANLRLPAFLLILVLIFSCTHSPKPKEDRKISDSTSVASVNTASSIDSVKDALVSFISGMGNGKNKCQPKLDSIIKWRNYADELDSMFSHVNSGRCVKMRTWADSELINSHSTTTVFYPFSGPDFFNANTFYPNADQYILIAMEPIGSLPDICNMAPVAVSNYLNSINNSMKDIFKRSYFITRKMSNDLYKTKVNGTVPLISLFIKRTGHNIVSMQKVSVDSIGNYLITDSLKNTKGIVSGIKIDFLTPPGEKVQSIIYFRADISDQGLEKIPGFKKYLNGLPQSVSYLKAASYLMHSENFKDIRSIIFDKSLTILQDDSGIAYKFFNKQEWNIKLYGKYVKPKDEFSYIREPDLEKAYKTSPFKPLPYSLGYNWGTDHVNMLYAVKKVN